MYLDERGLVSTGVGILLDPILENKYKVQFYRKAASGLAGPDPASDYDLKAEYKLVKDKSEPDPRTPGHLRPKSGWANYGAFESITNLRTKVSDVAGSALGMVLVNDRAVRQYFGPEYDTWPADVQVAIVQMGYAGGLKTRMQQGKLVPLLKARDFWGAKEYTYLSNPKSGKGGYLKHNKALEILMTNGWIIDQCRILGAQMNQPATPKDHTIFYGLTRSLWVSAWSTSRLPPRVEADDIVTGGDVTMWLNDWWASMLREKSRK